MASRKKESDEVRLRFELENYENDRDTLKALKLVSEREGFDFNVPPEIYWPKGQKQVSVRAAILMRCGVRYLQDKFGISESFEPKKVTEKAASSNPLDEL